MSIPCPPPAHITGPAAPPRPSAARFISPQQKPRVNQSPARWRSPPSQRRSPALQRGPKDSGRPCSSGSEPAGTRGSSSPRSAERMGISHRPGTGGEIRHETAEPLGTFGPGCDVGRKRTAPKGSAGRATAGKVTAGIEGREAAGGGGGAAAFGNRLGGRGGRPRRRGRAAGRATPQRLRDSRRAGMGAREGAAPPTTHRTGRPNPARPDGQPPQPRHRGPRRERSRCAGQPRAPPESPPSSSNRWRPGPAAPTPQRAATTRTAPTLTGAAPRCLHLRRRPRPRDVTRTAPAPSATPTPCRPRPPAQRRAAVGGAGRCGVTSRGGGLEISPRGFGVARLDSVTSPRHVRSAEPRTHPPTHAYRRCCGLRSPSPRTADPAPLLHAVRRSRGAGGRAGDP